VLLRKIQQLLELRRTEASAGKNNCPAGCLMMKLVLLETNTKLGIQILTCFRTGNMLRGKEIVSVRR